MFGYYAAAATALFSALLISPAVADQQNVTGLQGTWSSGAGLVSTGSGFANPVNFSFTYPPVTGISYSFTDLGQFEQAEYQMQANGSQPNCITGTVLWQHGAWESLANGSIILNPISIDGRLQVQDPCAAQSNVLFQFNTTVLISSWRVFSDPQRGPKLQMYKYDGSPYTPMYLIANPPNMLPTETLSSNLTVSGDGVLSAAHESVRKVGLAVLVGVVGIVGGVMAVL
ncbi:hypothetical protein DL93DRAFT_2074698 [Clavulina sp. PMI_390]|nr:hypothetical protein DL93DRAFT_2074698 [Clavulina sp. PMI_390]